MEARRRRTQRSVFFPFVVCCMPGVAQAVASEAASSIARGSEEEDDDDDDDDDDHEDKCLPDVHHASSNRERSQFHCHLGSGGSKIHNRFPNLGANLDPRTCARNTVADFPGRKGPAPRYRRFVT
jgi:hypothetical protein